jgi:hypothetical protein
MRFERETYQQADRFYAFLKKNKVDGSLREIIAKELNIPEQTARAIIYALENKDIIAGTAEKIDTVAKDTELIIGDIHYPFHDMTAIDNMINWAVANHDVNMVTFHGDVFDFYQISCFRKDPTRSARLYHEVAGVRSMLEMFRSAFPNATFRWLDGNHEERLQYYINEKAPHLKELLDGLLENKLGFDELGITKMTKFFKIGELGHLHGHERKGGWGVINVCRVLLMIIMENFVTHHYHTTQEYIRTRPFDGSIVGGWSVGHLALDSAFDYNPLNSWNQGFAIVEYDDKGEFVMHNKKICNGRIY